MNSDVRYASSGDIAIAYKFLNDSGDPLISVPGFITSVDSAAHVGAVRTFFEPFARFSRVLAFDKRGTGMSDRSLGSGSFEDRMDDIRAVMDDAGIESADVMGWSEGAPMALLFAAAFPERVRRLVLYAGYPRILNAPDYPIGLRPDVAEAFLEQLKALWGTGRIAEFFVQKIDASVREEAIEQGARAEQLMCTPTGAEQLMRSNMSSDVRHVLPLIKHRTLVIHCSGDPAVSVEHGRYLAEHIPDATWLEIDDDFHFSYTPEPWKPIHDAIEEFLTGRVPDAAPEPDRVLATVLFTDIVGSTERASELGDAAWRRLLDDHDRALAREVERFRGRVVKTTGDGALAVFDGPARGIRCAHAIRDAVAGSGLQIRAGLHTGEIEQRGDDVAGIAVHIGARIGSLAKGDEVLVSRTVVDLVAGSGLDFDDRGEHELSGVPGRWHVLAVSGGV